MNYCINAAWHGVDQSVALLRCNEAQVALIAAFRSSALLGLVSLIFLLTIPHRLSIEVFYFTHNESNIYKVSLF